MKRGEVWWANLPEPRGSEPGFRRPVFVLQADSFNLSRIQTVIVVVLTGNIDLAAAPGNVLLPARASGLPKDSVVNVSQVLTLDRQFLAERVGALSSRWREAVEDGLRLAMGL